MVINEREMIEAIQKNNKNVEEYFYQKIGMYTMY
jgi:hypothetical protein